MRKKVSGSSDPTILEEPTQMSEDTENLKGTTSNEKEKKKEETNKAESSDESAEDQDDVMDLEEEEEMALRFRRSSCIHGARRKSLDGLFANNPPTLFVLCCCFLFKSSSTCFSGLPTGQWSRRSSLVGKEFLSKDDEVTLFL